MKEEHLKHKKNELGDILKETEKEENDLLKNQLILNQRLMSPYYYLTKKLDQV